MGIMQFDVLDGNLSLLEHLEETSILTKEVLGLTAPQVGQSLLPVDLDTVNFVINDVIGLLEVSLDSHENITHVPNQVKSTV